MKNLALERKRVNLTQKQAAVKLRVAEKTLCKYENSPLSMPGDFIVRASRLYGCDAGYLLDLTEERNAVVKKVG